MLYNEEKMELLCKEYGIDVIKENGFPMLNGVEMTLKDLKSVLFNHDMTNDEKLTYTFHPVKAIELSINSTRTIYCDDMNLSFAA